MKLPSIVAGFFLLLHLTGSGQQITPDTTAVKSISYTVMRAAKASEGGRIAGLNLTITPDSTIYTYNEGQFDVDRNGNVKLALRIKRQKTEEAFWVLLLVMSRNREEFDHAPQGQSLTLIDGSDRIITITTKEREHSLTIDEKKIKNYDTIRPFLNVIQQKLDGFGHDDELAGYSYIFPNKP